MIDRPPATILLRRGLAKCASGASAAIVLIFAVIFGISVPSDGCHRLIVLLRLIVAVWSAGGRHTNADESKYVPKPGGAKAIDACFAFRFILKRRTKSVQNVQTCHFHPLPRGPHAHPQSLEFKYVVELTAKFYNIKIGCHKIALVRRYKCSKTVPGKTWQDVLSVNNIFTRYFCQRIA